VFVLNLATFLSSSVYRRRRAFLNREECRWFRTKRAELAHCIHVAKADLRQLEIAGRTSGASTRNNSIFAASRLNGRSVLGPGLAAFE
jgi:hypothetical protein